MSAAAVVERLDLPPEPSSVGQARAFVCGLLKAWGCEHLAETAALLTSELATNVIRHARTPYAVVVTRTLNGALIDVLDGSHATPVLRARDLTTDGGRGLALVACLAAAWGATPEDDLAGFAKGVRFSVS